MRQRNFYIIVLLLLSLVSCSQSGRRKTINNKQNTLTKSQKTNSVSKVNQMKNGKTVVNIVKSGGVFEVPIEINDVKMHFIFDTGAGIVSISETEALFLWKQGSLTESDILGVSNFIDATGDISAGTIINLKTVKIGNRILHNVEASVVHNLEAPLLLGQSVLEQFGKISIDYTNNQITLE